MRETFIRTLTELARTDDRIYILTADMGFGMVDPFAKEFPDRFINVGVAEQNMIGVTTGLALSGKVVFCYSISTFPTLRCLDQIRNDVCAHKANVTIVAGGTGLTYGELGSTHPAIQDIACMRRLQAMAVIAPGDTVETRLATSAIVHRGGSCYLRIGRCEDAKYMNNAHFADSDYYADAHFKIGKANKLEYGKDATIITTGAILPTAVLAVQKLYDDHIHVSLLSMHTIKPLDSVAILAAARETKVIITIEEHSIIGGLGSVVAEVLADNQVPCKFKRMGIPDEAINKAYSWEELRKLYRLTVEDIVSEVKVICVRK